jgi:transposase
MANQPKFSPLGFSQAGILFCTEGNPVAVLVTARKASPRATKAMRFDQAEAALAWCRAHGAALIYCPAAPDRN